ncbi:flagellar basal-body rod protein FlgF [Izhakiella australiensis]|uniref:Flagellar basal-body rod protein FlgF n=1 Tax=Izhakiella australiensis TaxID=1926881 RepID=A0A1S8YIW0_9GAMM|nr:flagellar basal-body rod protein FlgF [Izhakiella australiensis]OON38757.1 flagellar basal-body rod protein FlgF [Izhakiella australiensis]
MDRLIYTAVSGANRSLMQQQIHANNLSNANTDGFRADLERATSEVINGYGYHSRVQVSSSNGGIDLTPGVLQETGRDLDVAIKGSGLFAVRDAGREAYTRSGHIEVDDAGNLTIRGKPLLGIGGPIQLPPFTQVSVGVDGTITIVPDDGDVQAAFDVDRIKLVDIPAARLSKNNQGLMVTNRAVNPASEEVRLTAGHLEASNVSAIDEMVQTIALSRHFETQIKMMKVADTLAQAGNRLIRGT